MTHRSRSWILFAVILGALSSCLAQEVVSNRLIATSPRIAKQKAEAETAQSPESGHWREEVLHEETSIVLKAIGAYLKGEKALPPSLSNGWKGGAVRPEKMVLVSDSQPFEIYRAEEVNGQKMQSLEEALGGLLAVFTIGGFADFAFLKEWSVEISEDGSEAVTLVHAALAGPTSKGRVEITADWKCHWTLIEGTPPQLVSIAPARHIEVHSREGALFREVTTGLFEGKSAPPQLRRDTHHWMKQIEGHDIRGLHGISVADLDGDGDFDLHIAQGKGVPNVLLRREADGTMTDVAPELGVDFLDDTRSALLLDLDHDGDRDLVLAIQGVVLCLSNEGADGFKERFRLELSDPMSMSARDVDDDGFLDLYICNYSRDHREVGALANPTLYQDATNGARNVLLRGLPGCRFEEATETFGFDQDNDRFSLACAWSDFDGDGDDDLYVANDFGRNLLYRDISAPGEQARFKNVAAELGVEDQSFGMSAVWSDFDRNGTADLYVANMFSSAGNRLAALGTETLVEQRKTRPELAERLTYLARGNSLFLGGKDGAPWIDATFSAEVNRGWWSWGSAAGDLNNDGFPDLLVSNGFISTDGVGDL